MGLWSWRVAKRQTDLLKTCFLLLQEFRTIFTLGPGCLRSTRSRSSCFIHQWYIWGRIGFGLKVILLKRYFPFNLSLITFISRKRFDVPVLLYVRSDFQAFFCVGSKLKLGFWMFFQFAFPPEWHFQSRGNLKVGPKQETNRNQLTYF